jgi:hypothetical protein
LAISSNEFRFVIEKFELAWRTSIEHIDNTLYLRFKMRRLWGEGIHAVFGVGERCAILLQ